MSLEATRQILSEAANHLQEHPFRSHSWLWSGGLQTIVGSRQRREFPWGWKECEKNLLTLADGSRVRVEFLLSEPEAPTLVAIHGMSGSSRSLYMQAFSHKAFHNGWNFLLLNLYDVRTEPANLKIFHAGCSREVQEILELFARVHPLRELFLVGISMGGNILLRLLGELGSEGPQKIRAAAAISPLVDLMASWPVLDKPSNFLYRRYYLRRLKALLRRKAVVLKRFVDLSELQRVRTILDFDELVTAPLAGFKNAFHYYREASSWSWLGSIQVPTLLIHSKDDPLLPWEPLTRGEGSEDSSIHVHLTDRGGHVAYIADNKEADIDRSWAENRVVDFFRLVERRP
jgi:predicted alpha/beta-fold hydrolase